jgi:hypothetical protein
VQSFVHVGVPVSVEAAFLPGMFMVTLIYRVHGATGHRHCGAGLDALSRCWGKGGRGWGAGGWSGAVRDAPDDTWAASRAPAWHGGVRGREGNQGPTQAAVRNEGEHVVPSGVEPCHKPSRGCRSTVFANSVWTVWGGDVEDKGPLQCSCMCGMLGYTCTAQYMWGRACLPVLRF